MLSWLQLILCFLNSPFSEKASAGAGAVRGPGWSRFLHTFFSGDFCCMIWGFARCQAPPGWRHYIFSMGILRNLEFATVTGLGGSLKMHVGQWRWSWTYQMSLALYVWSHCWGTKIQPRIKKHISTSSSTSVSNIPSTPDELSRSIDKLGIFGHLRLRIAGPPPHPPPHYPPVAAAPGWTEEGELVTSAWSGDIFRRFISNFAPLISILVSNAFILDQIWIPFNLDSS